MIDLLLPRTDAGVLAQVAFVAVAAGIALLAVRRHAELRVLVAGIALFAFGLMALRALH